MSKISDGGFGVVPYGSFTAYTPALPQFYWDVYSAEQRIKHICFEIDKLIKYADSLGTNMNWLYDALTELQAALDELADNIPEKFASQIQAWIDSHMESIIKAAIRMVFFGLTDDTYKGGTGYFVAYIPESWNEIVFDTGADPNLDTYGRLILRWDADSPYTVEQPPEYSYYSAPGLNERLDSIQATAENALSLSQTNESDLALTEADVTELQGKLENVTKISTGQTYDQIADTGYLYDQKGA